MEEFRIGSVVRVKEGIREQCKYWPGLEQYFDRDLVIVAGDPSHWAVDICLRLPVGDVVLFRGGQYTFHESAIELVSNPEDEIPVEVSDATAILDF